jgi:hypothetical protein
VGPCLPPPFPSPVLSQPARCSLSATCSHGLISRIALHHAVFFCLPALPSRPMLACGFTTTSPARDLSKRYPLCFALPRLCLCFGNAQVVGPRANADASLKGLREHLLAAAQQSPRHPGPLEPIESISTPPAINYGPTMNSTTLETSAESRKGRRELSTSKRAAQNRAAQVSSPASLPVAVTVANALCEGCIAQSHGL